jgi:hypothetical protein
MATNPKLIKDWIQFLKNKQIVAYQSDPSTGQLKYKRKVNVDDISQFLNVKTDFSEEQITVAIQQVLAKKGSPKDSKLSQTPDAIRKREQRAAASQKNKAGSGAFGQMAQQLQKPDEKGEEPEERKPRLPGSSTQKRKFTYKRLREAFADKSGPELDEKDIEEIFGILSAQNTDQGVAATSSQDAGTAKKKKEISPEENIAKKQEDMVKIRELIRDTLTSGQRKALWRALNDI